MSSERITTMSKETLVVGLFGYPVEHSLSPAMHNAAFAALGLDYNYILLPCPSEDFTRLVQDNKDGGLVGWNVTVPHKERMLPFLDAMSDEVAATGACNTVRVRDGKLTGFNTDVYGFMQALAEAGGIYAGATAVLLGAGGASRAVAWALARAGYDLILLSRKPEQAKAVADALQVSPGVSMAHGSLDGAMFNKRLEGAGLLVNCTPAGQWPRVEQSPLPDGARLPEHLLVYDLVYKPRPTRLLREAANAGCRTQDGLAMLIHQGAAAFELWTGRVAPVEIMRRACLEALGVRPDAQKSSPPKIAMQNRK